MLKKNILLKNDGIALVTSLMMTLISLTIIMAVMYMISQNITRSSGIKTYKTALAASYGGSQMIIKEIVPQLLKSYSNVDFITDIQNSFSLINLTVNTTNACIQDKLTKKSSDWHIDCSKTFGIKDAPDFSFSLQAAGGQSYAIYTKVVDTVIGNTDTSGLQLEGAGVAETTSVLSPKHVPYVYRVEIQGERSVAAVERAQLTVLYAY